MLEWQVLSDAVYVHVVSYRVLCHFFHSNYDILATKDNK